MAILISLFSVYKVFFNEIINSSELNKFNVIGLAIMLMVLLYCLYQPLMDMVFFVIVDLHRYDTKNIDAYKYDRQSDIYFSSLLKRLPTLGVALMIAYMIPALLFGFKFLILVIMISGLCLCISKMMRDIVLKAMGKSLKPPKEIVGDLKEIWDFKKDEDKASDNGYGNLSFTLSIILTVVTIAILLKQSAPF